MSAFEALLLEPFPFHRFIAIRQDGIAGSGTCEDPWDGSTQAKFDAIMVSFASPGADTNVVIHLGPGTFETKGYSDTYLGSNPQPGWEMLPGMKIEGSGMTVTTIKVITSSVAAAGQSFAIGHRLADGGAAKPATGCEVKDLTIDCNAGASNIACGAIRLMGDNILVQRVKAINWGNNITTDTKRGYVFALIVVDPATNTATTNPGFDDCIAVEPKSLTPSYLNELFIFHAGSKDYDPAGDYEMKGRSPYIRNCWVDGGTLATSGSYASKFRALSMDSCIAGRVEGNQVHNIWIGGPYLKTWSARELIIRNNIYKNVVYGPCLEMGGLGHQITIPYLERNDGSSKLAKATTGAQQAHKLSKGDRVKITGASPSEYNGVFVVVDVPFPYVFIYEMASRPASNATGGISMYKVFGVEKLTIESNIIELAPFTTTTTPIGIYLTGEENQSIPLGYVYGDVQIGWNHIRYLDGKYAGNYLGYAIDVSGVRNLISRHNVFNLDPANPSRNQRCGTATYFNNKLTKGTLIRGYQTLSPAFSYTELQDEAEEAFLLGICRKR